MKKILYILAAFLCICALDSCSKEYNENKFYELIESKEHDPRLFGDWFLKDDGKLFFTLNGESPFRMGSEDHYFWFTENGRLYYQIRHFYGSPHTEVYPETEYPIYTVSEDGNTLTLDYQRQAEFEGELHDIAYTLTRNPRNQ